MTHREKKIAKIIEELTMYFFAVGATEIESGIELEDNQAIIRFRANYDAENKDKLSRLEEYFNEPKNEGLEDCYWELAGSGDPGESSQLILIGMMIDSHEVHRYGNEVEIVLYKNKELEW